MALTEVDAEDAGLGLAPRRFGGGRAGGALGVGADVAADQRGPERAFGAVRGGGVVDAVAAPLAQRPAVGEGAHRPHADVGGGVVHGDVVAGRELDGLAMEVGGVVAAHEQGEPFGACE
ncbi:hypothetical protein [Streptosporangium sandarakinum]|uniref:hypothetical protein n=1 Tax=Streptosporangium sandarakinum TaxID=1260955 RepID=UPI00378EDFBF